MLKYENKPFKPPRRTDAVTNINKNSSALKRPIKRSLGEVDSSSDYGNENSSCSDAGHRYFATMYRKVTMKKHKTWNHDGYAVYKVRSGIIQFYDDSGKLLSSMECKCSENELMEFIFTRNSMDFQLDMEFTTLTDITNIKNILVRETAGKSNTSETKQVNSIKSLPSTLVPVSRLFASHTVTKFKPSFKRQDVLMQRSGTDQRKYLPVFDVEKIANPLVMDKPYDAQVDVVVDPLLSNVLRPHQREGVKFMYNCIMGLNTSCDSVTSKSDWTKTARILEYDSDINGCLLADDMGLGKTLMTITVIWSLLRQTPWPSKVSCSQSGSPLSGMCKKVLIVCPVTLIGNWKREFAKWLTLRKIGVLTLNSKNTPDMDKSAIKNFLHVQRTYQVVIVGYEKLLSIEDELKKEKNLIDLLICDEGHRLKNGNSKVLTVLKNLDISRKILLTGTPIQNDLNEFFTILDFVNPGVLGTYSQFKRNFEVPISRARDIANKYNTKVVEAGQEKSNDLIDLTKRFVLRRTNDILAKYLPPKTDAVLFCNPTNTQLLAFDKVLKCANINLNTLNYNSSLGLITLFKKICNSPSLIHGDSCFNKKELSDNNSLTLGLTNGGLISGKLQVLMILLERIRELGSKVVVVSNYTQTLDIIGNLMSSASMVYTRLDGSTPPKQRDTIVNTFNKNPHTFGFLLSAKSGGVGLNLIGANNLILFDNDWNPSVDLQAMGRIHRDGQTQHCYIYRLITTGCIDEKIFQRQLMKNNLSQKFLDANSTSTGVEDDFFTKEDLKDLFSVQVDTRSNTHDLICSCDGTYEANEALASISESSNTDQLAEAPLNTWTSALEAIKIQEQMKKKDEEDKKNRIARCLIGYKHIDPKQYDENWSATIGDPNISHVLKSLSEHITFAFIHSK